ncbi:MAG: phosphonate transporter [Bacteroidetes bacterium QH_10_64_19]|nr:MAG: phosphonate transporter [Bacteroidetes bacterium QH_10_64_19]
MPSSQNPYSYLQGEEPDADQPPEDPSPEGKEPATDLAFDDEGTVQFYNRYESNLSGVPPEEARDTNFFTELAPCSNNPLFWGRFKEGVDQGELDEYFTYTFTYKMRPTLVDVRLYRDEAGNNWIMIQKR